MQYHHMEKFTCNMCGDCCRNLRGKVNTNIFKEIPESKLGPLFGTSLSELTLPIFDWEKRRLEKRARKLKIEVKFKPLSFVFDVTRQKVIVLCWNLDHNDCPFLKANKCEIYDHRPLICKSYPLLDTGVLPRQVVLPLGECSAVTNDMQNKFIGHEDRQTYFKKLYDIFDKNYLMDALRLDFANFFIGEIFKQLQRCDSKLLTFSSEPSKQEMDKIYKHFKEVSLLEFLIENGIITQEYVSMNINSINSDERASEAIDMIINKDVGKL